MKSPRLRLALCLATGLLLTTPRGFGEESPAPAAVRIASGVSGHIHPSLCITRKGTLVAVFCQKEGQPYLITRSTDAGKTWSEPTLFPPTANVSIYPGSLTVLADGRLVHAWNVWFSPDEKSKSRYVAFSVSNDDGLTWSESKALKKDEDPKIHSVIRHPIVELSPTSWLLSLADRTVLYNPETGEETRLGQPADHGLVPIVRTTKGTWISGRGKRSTDGGQTWQEVKPFPDIFTQGWRHEMIALKNGWLLASQIVGPGVGGDRIDFVVSRDDGQSWDLDHPVAFYNPGRPIGGRACPRTVEIDDHTLGTIYYDTDAKQPGGSGLFFQTTPLATLSGQPSAGAPAALPPIESAVSDAQGRIVVNGKPFFPILLYDVPTDAKSLKKFHDQGFNVVTVAKTEEAEAAGAAGLYGAAHGKKIDRFESVLLAIGIDSPVLNLKPPLLDNLKANLEKVRTEIPNRPVMHAIGYWLNEPQGVISNELPPPEKYEAVVQTIDVAAPYLYPIPYQPIRSVGEAVARAAAATGGKKPILPILQIFAWAPTDRYPNAAELKCMVYLSLIHGARGIGYYSYNHVTGKKGVTFAQDQPEVWNSLKDVNRELAQIGPFLLNSTPDSSVTLTEPKDGVELLGVSRDKSRLILLANPSDTIREVTLKFASNREGAMKSLNRGSELVIHDGWTTIQLDAFGTAAFITAPTP